VSKSQPLPQVAATYRKRAELQSAIDELDARIAHIEGQAAKADKAVAEAQQRFQAACMQAVIDGRELPSPDESTAEVLRKSAPMKTASASAQAQLRSERKSLALQLADATAAWRGDVYAETARLQNEAVADAIEVLAQLADPLARLHAADLAREALCGQQLKLTGLDPAQRPYSGQAATRALLNALPSRFQSTSLNESRIRELAAPQAASLVESFKPGKA
jgi:hypothetical protein